MLLIKAAENPGLIHTSLLKELFKIWIFLCFSCYRGNWIISCKTRTTWCLFLLFMEDKNKIKGECKLTSGFLLFWKIFPHLMTCPPALSRQMQLRMRGIRQTWGEDATPAGNMKAFSTRCRTTPSTAHSFKASPEPQMSPFVYRTSEERNCRGWPIY